MNFLRRFNNHKINFKNFCSFNNKKINDEIFNINKKFEKYNINYELIMQEITKISIDINKQQHKINKVIHIITLIENITLLTPFVIIGSHMFIRFYGFILN